MLGFALGEDKGNCSCFYWSWCCCFVCFLVVQHRCSFWICTSNGEILPVVNVRRETPSLHGLALMMVMVLELVRRTNTQSRSLVICSNSNTSVCSLGCCVRHWAAPLFCLPDVLMRCRMTSMAPHTCLPFFPSVQRF